jgi:hypothetical protein
VDQSGGEILPRVSGHPRMVKIRMRQRPGARASLPPGRRRGLEARGRQPDGERKQSPNTPRNPVELIIKFLRIINLVYERNQ